MKKLLLFMTAVALGTLGTQAAKMDDTQAVATGYRYGNSFIFVENGVTFSVYPDGEFDFYMDNRVNVGIGAQIGNVGITFNSGYDYNPFVQYDDYGAVIQVENIPIYYDYYGRVSQIGDVDIHYNNGRVRRIGGLHIYYNGAALSHYTGYINIHNRHYVYRPFHGYFTRPAIGFCNVYTKPYRRYYAPVRYTYYVPYRNNQRRAYATIGKQYRDYNQGRRAEIYRNDKRVAVRQDNNLGRRSQLGRSNRVAQGVQDNGSAKAVSRSATNATQGSSVGRATTHTQRESTPKRPSATAQRQDIPNNGIRQGGVGRSGEATARSANPRTQAPQGNSRTVTKKEVVRTPTQSKVTQRRVSTTPNGRTVTKSSTTVQRPEARKSSPAVKQSSGNTVNRSGSARTSSSRSSRGN